MSNPIKIGLAFSKLAIVLERGMPEPDQICNKASSDHESSHHILSLASSLEFGRSIHRRRAFETTKKCIAKPFIRDCSEKCYIDVLCWQVRVTSMYASSF